MMYGEPKGLGCFLFIFGILSLIGIIACVWKLVEFILWCCEHVKVV